MWMRPTVFLLSTAGLVAVASAQPSMRDLHYLVGDWEATVTFFDENGEPRRETRSETSAELALDGAGIEQTGGIAEPPISARSLYAIDARSGEVRWAALGSTGTLYVFRGALDEGVLTLTTGPEPRARGEGTVRFRRVDRAIQDESYESAMYLSEDGESWRLLNRQVNRRTTPASTRSALDALSAYAGNWLAERRTNREGEAFRFRYVLEPYDEKATIYEMTITQEFENERTALLWKGFKGWDPVGNETYYRGFSPSGRVGDGTLVLAGDELETVYIGYGPDGQSMRIRDVFTRTRQNPDRFRSVTYLFREGAWQQVNEDHWERQPD